MSLFQRTLPTLRVAARSAQPKRSIAAFSTSTLRTAMSENDHDHPDRAEHIDKHKKDSVNRAKSGSGEWKPELATKSEQDMQGDKTTMSMDEMQKLGEQKAKKGQQPAGSSSNKA